MIDLVNESDPILQQKPVSWPFGQTFPTEAFETPWYYAQGGQVPNPQKFYNLMFENISMVHTGAITAQFYSGIDLDVTRRDLSRVRTIARSVSTPVI